MRIGKKPFFGSLMCFRSTELHWLNHRKGRMRRYSDSASLCTEMIGAENFNKLDQLVQLHLKKTCDRIRTRLTDLSLEYTLRHTVPLVKGSDVELLIKKKVTFEQYRAFMRSIFHYLFPSELVGEKNMRSAINRISSVLFEIGFNESVNLCDLYSIPFRTSALKWLNHVSSRDKCRIHRRILLWLLNFSIVLTRVAFYVTPESRAKRLCFYRKNVWKRIESDSFRLLSEKRDIKKVKGVERKTVGVSVRFIPKNKGTRPLIVSTGNSFQKRKSVVAMKLASVVIDQVCAVQRNNSKEFPHTGAAVWNGINSFVTLFRKFFSMNKSARIYAVKTDIKECFDCINQDLLRSVLRGIIVPDKHYRLSNTRLGMRTLNFARRLAFGCGIVDHNRDVGKICITGEMVLQLLEIYAISKEFLYRDGVYQAFRGIPQGNHASTRLCNLYLGAADHERYAEMMGRHDTLLMRYMDDYLLLSTDLNVALKFLEVMHFGMDDHYDIICDPAKTVINFRCENDKLYGFVKTVASHSAVAWCGYTVYPGLRKFGIDWARMQPEKVSSCRIMHKMKTSEKRVAILRFLKMTLFEKYRMIYHLPAGKWRVRVLKKFAALGAKFYATPYARKVRLSMKGRWNRIFWQRLQAWIRQGFRYRYNIKLAHLYGRSSSLKHHIV